MRCFLRIAVVAAASFWRVVVTHGDEVADETWTAPAAVVDHLKERLPDANFDEQLVRAYTLPDPLLAADGSAVTRDTWPRRRSEILDLFRTQVYGRAPADRPENLTFETLEEDPRDLDGRATRKLVEIAFDTPHAGWFRFRVQLYLPNEAPRPVKTFVLLQFQGLTDRATPQIIERGFALAVLDRTQLAADDAATFRHGIINAYSGDGPLAPDAWRAIAAWAWGASRVLDYLETEPAIDPHGVAVVGHSRMGKTALWAGAADPRFAVTYSNESGCGGGALSRRAFGETVQRINNVFPHWFCENFHRYGNREADLPVDQHMLVALAAPRPVYVASADEDLWADPRGEFLACLGADPVYRLLGVEGLAADRMPPLETPIATGRIGYHIRRGTHGFTDYDWRQYLDFASRHLPSDED